MDPSVKFPASPTRTTPLGVGMATLMREPSPSVQHRLLHAAYEAGFRHFDVAPSYGLGAAERVLGRFLRSRPEGVTIATKVGILARGNAGVMRLIQQPARALVRRFPSLRGRATEAVGSVVHVPADFSIPTCERSLETSLRSLGVPAIDLYLLHDPRPSDVSDEVVEWLARQKERGVVRNVGVAGSPESVGAIVQARPGFFDAVQVPSHILAPALTLLPPETPGLRLTHSLLAIPMGRITRKMQEDPAWVRGFSRHLGEDAKSMDVVPRMLLAWGLLENPDGTVLIGASKEEHLRVAPLALGRFAPDRLDAAAAYLRETLAAS